MRSTSSADALERTRRSTAGSTARPKAQIDHKDILERYRGGDTTGRRLGSTQGANGHASKLPMLSDQRTSAKDTQVSDTKAASNAARIEAMRRNAAANSAEARTTAGRQKASEQNAARTKAARENASADQTAARVKAAREKASADQTDGRIKAAREKASKTASNDARIKTEREKYLKRLQDARNGAVQTGGGLTSGGPNALTPQNTPITNGEGGVWGTGHDDYYNSCYWNYWGNCWPCGWCNWWCAPSYCCGYWWNSYWWCGGSWNRPWNCYWYGPWIPWGYSIVIYEEPEPEIIYIEVPVDEEVLDEVVEQPVTFVPSQGTDPGLQRELNRAAAYYLTQGDRAFRETRYGDAAHFYAKAVEFSPDSGILYLVLSDALFATGDYRYAAYALRQALTREPSLASNVIDKRDFYADPSDFDRQLATLERFVEDHVLDMDARLVLAANYLFGGRPEAAIGLFDDPFSEELRGTPEGRLLLEVAQQVQFGEPEIPVPTEGDGR